MKYSLDVTILGLPLLQNQLNTKHWAARHSHALKWKRNIELKIAGHAKKPKEPVKKAKLVLTRLSSRRPDPDGLCGSFKCIIDALVRMDVLVDDKFDNIGFPTYEWAQVKQKQGSIRIELQEI